MNKKIKQILGIICFISFFFNALSYGDLNSELELVLTNLDSYFKKIYSVEFESHMIMQFDETIQLQKSPPIKQYDLHMKFVSNGIKYRSEVTFFDAKLNRNTTKIISYNGQVYQLLEIGDVPILSVSKKPITSNLYGGPHPIIAPFAFIFGPEDTVSFETLQNYRSLLLKDTIKEAKMMSVLGYEGITLKFNKKGLSGKEYVFEVFFAKELKYFPLFCKQINQVTGEVDEIKVLKTKKFGEGIDEIVIPISIELNAYFTNGKIGQHVIMEIDPNTVKLNHSIKEEIFNIPFSQASRVMDADANIWFEPNKR